MRRKSTKELITKKDGQPVRLFLSYGKPVAAQIGKRYYRTTHYFNRRTDDHINEWLKADQVEEKPQWFFDELKEEAT